MMFYYSDLLQPGSLTAGVRQAESLDLWHWRRMAASSDHASRPPGGRDPFALRNGARWLLFSVGVEADLRGQILCSESLDPTLRTWSPAVPVVTEPAAANPSWRSDLQSPCVVRYDTQYYLFVTRRSSSPLDYVRTDVLCSSDPRHFDWRPITELRAHAAEVVMQDGRYFITSAGWPRAIGEEHRGLSVAPLGWASNPRAIEAAPP
jgi:arabinan endo-1,5-alpha-L-arabinosidase